MNTIGDRIRQSRIEISQTQPGLAKAVGVSKGTISLWENDINEPGGKNLHSLAAALNKTPEYLLRGVKVDIDKGSACIARKVPLIAWKAIDEWCNSTAEFTSNDLIEWLIIPYASGNRSFALRVETDAMVPKSPGERYYPQGTIIFVDPDAAIKNSCRVVARVNNGAYTFKSYFEDTDAKYLKALNADYSPINITDSGHVCGVVIGSYLPE